jgi:hypothetical protein
MRTPIRYFAVAACLCLAAAPAIAQQALVEKVDIKAIKSIEVTRDSAGFRARVVVLISNENETRVRFRKTAFEVYMNAEKRSESTLLLGTAKAEFVLESTPKSPLNIVPFDIDMGSMETPARAQETLTRFVKLVNLIGEPTNQINMHFEGSGEVGVEERRGWIDQVHLKASLRFRPQVQREVLFQ